MTASRDTLTAAQVREAGLADWLFAQILTPTLGAPWRSEMEARARSARTVLAAHPWGLGLVESRRSAGPAALRATLARASIVAAVAILVRVWRMVLPRCARRPGAAPPSPAQRWR